MSKPDLLHYLGTTFMVGDRVTWDDEVGGKGTIIGFETSIHGRMVVVQWDEPWMALGEKFDVESHDPEDIKHINIVERLAEEL
jgi:hypothetical protein